MNEHEQAAFLAALEHTNIADLASKDVIEKYVRDLHDETLTDIEDKEMYEARPELHCVLIDLFGFWSDATRYGRDHG